MEKPVIYLIVGPTASGKTAVSIQTAKKLDCEIISADSVQIYRGLDIGSAKPTPEEREGVPHYLLDCVNIDEEFNVALYRKKAIGCIDDIIQRGKKPLIVGGTGLYVNSLIFPLNFSNAKPNLKRRDELTGIEKENPGTLHKMLEKIDPASAERIHPNDIKRTIRAIEIYESTGENMTAAGGDFTNERNTEIPFEPVIAGLTMDRAHLYERIEKRVDEMLQNGLLDEVKRIHDAGYSHNLTALQALGYKQLLMYLIGECSIDEAVELIKRDTRRFAKRQISWFKRDKRIKWFNTDEFESADALSDAVCEYFSEKR